MGAEKVQGYVYSKPVADSEIHSVLRSIEAAHFKALNYLPDAAVRGLTA
ncbi:MAG: hypothetical protein K8F90_06450 [Hyphomicrobiales bacterium]|nr:hypothetical protein [Hyphomicrobiales bacterium]